MKQYYNGWIVTWMCHQTKSILLADHVKAPRTCSSSAVSISRPVTSSIRWLIFSIVECSYPDSQALEWGKEIEVETSTKAINMQLYIYNKQTACHNMHIHDFHIMFKVRRFLMWNKMITFFSYECEMPDCVNGQTSETVKSGNRVNNRRQQSEKWVHSLVTLNIRVKEISNTKLIQECEWWWFCVCVCVCERERERDPSVTANQLKHSS